MYHNHPYSLLLYAELEEYDCLFHFWNGQPLHYISGLVESEGDAWMRKYIFPGGVIPSLREIVSLSADYKFYTTDIESLRTHYMKTLKII